MPAEREIVTVRGVAVEFPTPRECVTAAAEAVEDTNTRDWLLCDAYGTWEADARKELDEVRTRWESGELRSGAVITTDTVLVHVSNRLAARALSAQLAYQRGRAVHEVPKRRARKSSK